MSRTRTIRPAGIAVTAGVALLITGLAVRVGGGKVAGVIDRTALADVALLGGVAAMLLAAALTAFAGLGGTKPARHAAADTQDEPPATDMTRTIRDLGRGGKIAVAAAVVVIAAAMATLITIGLIGSFFTVRGLVQPTFHEWAWTVPAVLDVGAIILIVGSFLAAFIGLGVPALRLVTVGWLSGTVALNIAAAHDAAGNFDLTFAIAHAAMPFSVIVFCEIFRAVLFRWAKLTRVQPVTEYERYPLSDWAFSPVATFWRWRRRRLWRLRSLAEADAAEARYALAKGQIRRQYGEGKSRMVNWRWKAPYHILWALRHDQLLDREIKRVRQAVSAELFGDVLAAITGNPADQPPPPTPPNPQPDQQPRRTPPSKPRHANGNAGGSTAAAVQARVEDAYTFYVDTVQREGREPSGSQLMGPLGITNDGRARHRRTEFRDRFVAEHGYDPSVPASQNGHAPAGAAQ